MASELQPHSSKLVGYSTAGNHCFNMLGAAFETISFDPKLQRGTGAVMKQRRAASDRITRNVRFKRQVTST